MYSIIAAKRLRTIFLTLILCSAIIVSSTSILFSIQNILTDIYGDTDDVIVIYDESANTPYTSIVPKSTRDVLKQIDGIEKIDAEKILPVLAGNQPTYLRSVDWTDFNSINDLIFTEGQEFIKNDKTSVVVGVNLAEKLSLKTGSEFIISSTLNNKRAYVTISGIIYSKTNSKHNDEIFTNFALGEEFSITKNSYTHILVKLDENKISREKMFEIISMKNSVQINSLEKNGTIESYSWELFIYNYENALILNEIRNKQLEIQLPYGKYFFQSRVGQTYSNIISKFIESNTTINLLIDPITYNLKLEMKKSETKLDNFFYQILNHENKVIINNFTDSNGLNDHFLSRGVYFLKFWSGYSANLQKIVMDKSQKVEVQLNNYNSSSIQIIGMVNGTTINDEVGVFRTNYLLDETSITIDNKNILPFLNHIPFQITEGNHNISIQSEKVGNTFYKFNLKKTNAYIEPIGFTNNSYINQNQELSFKLIDFDVNQRVNAYLNDQILDISFINNEILKIKNNSTYMGLSRLRIEFKSITNNFHTIQFLLNVEKSNAPIANLLTKTNKIYLMDQLNNIPYYWSSINFDILVNKEPANYNSTHIFLSNISENMVKLEFVSKDMFHSSRSYEIYKTNTILDQITVSIDDKSQILTSLTTINADSFSLSYDDTQYKVQLITNNYSLNAIPTMYPTKIANENIISIQVISKLSGIVLQKTISIQNDTDNFIPITADMYSEKISGMILMHSPLNHSLEWTFTSIDGENSAIIEGDIAYLSTGNWNVTVNDLTYNLDHSYLVEVHKWVRSVDLNESTVEVLNWKNHYSDGSLFILEGIKYYFDNMIIFNDPIYSKKEFLNYFDYINYYKNNTDNYIQSSKIYSSNNFSISLNPIIEKAEITVNNINGISMDSSFEYEGSITLYSSIHYSNNIQINIKGKTHYGHNLSYNYSIWININTIETNVTFTNQILSNNLSSINFENFNNQNSVFNVYRMEFSRFDLVNSIIYDYQINDTQSANFNKNFNLMEGKWNLTIIYQSFKFFWVFTVNDTIKCNISYQMPNIATYDANYQKKDNFFGMIQVQDTITLESYISIFNPIKTIPIVFQESNIVLFADYSYASTTIKHSDQNIIVPYAIKRETGIIYIDGEILINKGTLSIHHIGANETQIIRKFGTSWVLTNFPVGEITIEFSQGSSSYLFNKWFEPSKYPLIISINNENVNINDWFGVSGVIITSNSNQISNEAFNGPFRFIKVIIYSEIIIILLVLISNLVGIFTGVINDSKREFKIAKNIGFSKHQLIMSLFREIKVIGLIAGLIGLLLGYVINSILLTTNNLTLFGYQFVPSYSPLVWIINIAGIYISAYVSTVIGLISEEIL